MSYTPSEMFGVCAMVPSFGTPDAREMTATSTINVDALQDGLDRGIKDGMNFYATMGTFGQCWNLLWDEFKTMVTASNEAVNNRVPLFHGVTSSNPREVVQKMKFVRDNGGQGVLLGLPYYDSLPTRDIPTFYRNIAELFPDLSIMIYSNPENHRVLIPVAAFRELVKNLNIICLKDSHRSANEVQRLHDIIHGKISHMCNEGQLYPYMMMGCADGFWCHRLWSGPWPVLAYRDAAEEGDWDRVRAIGRELSGNGDSGDSRGLGEMDRSRYGNYTTHYFAGYVNIGPPRPPFSFHIQDPVEDAKAQERAKRGAERWQVLCEKYRPEVEARRAATAAV